MSAHSALETKDDSSTGEHSNATPTQYPTKGRLIFILICLVLGKFLVAIDTTIIYVAVPKISTDFRALNDVGWYGSAYLMTLTALQPTMNKIYGIFHRKGLTWRLLLSLKVCLDLWGLYISRLVLVRWCTMRLFLATLFSVDLTDSSE